MKDGIASSGIQLSNISRYLDPIFRKAVRDHLAKINLDFRTREKVNRICFLILVFFSLRMHVNKTCRAEPST